MSNHVIPNIDPEDFEDFLFEVEKSFKIRFTDAECEGIRTFGEVCDIVKANVNLEEANDCTSQQGFYKLRQAFSTSLGIAEKEITPDSSLHLLIPKNKRRRNIKVIEQQLGFKLNLLEPPTYVSVSLVVLLLAGFVLPYFLNDGRFLFLIIFSLFGAWLSLKLGKEFKVKTVGEVVRKMSRESYVDSRRNATTANKTEIELILTDWFCECFYIDPTTFSRNQYLVKEPASAES